MRFSIWPDTSRPFSEIAELVTHCEATGWDRAYLADHFMPDASANRTVPGRGAEPGATMPTPASTSSSVPTGPWAR